MSVVQRTAAAVLAATLAAGLSSCAAGFNSATDRVQADNAAGEAGPVLARALVIVKSKNAIPAALAGTLINSGAQGDVLERIELTEDRAGARTITLMPDLTLAPGEVAAFGTEGKDPLTVPDAAELHVGTIANVVLRFRTAGEIRLQVPVVVRAGFYSDIAPTVPPALVVDSGATPEPTKATKSARPKGPSASPDPTVTEPADDGGVIDATPTSSP